MIAYLASTFNLGYVISDPPYDNFLATSHLHLQTISSCWFWRSLWSFESERKLAELCSWPQKSIHFFCRAFQAFPRKTPCIKLHLNATCSVSDSSLFSCTSLENFPHFPRRQTEKPVTEILPLFLARTTRQLERCMQCGGRRQTKHEQATSGSHKYFLNFQIKKRKREGKSLLHGKWPVREWTWSKKLRVSHRVTRQ